MRTTVIATVLFSLSVSWGSSQMDTPPFWLFSFYELQGLGFQQEESYFKQVEELAKHSQLLGPFTVAQLRSAAESEQGWKVIETLLQKQCLSREQKTQKVCQKIADLRVEILIQRSVRGK